VRNDDQVGHGQAAQHLLQHIAEAVLQLLLDGEEVGKLLCGHGGRVTHGPERVVGENPGPVEVADDVAQNVQADEKPLPADEEGDREDEQAAPDEVPLIPP
jgi:hypothetical protein